MMKSQRTNLLILSSASLLMFSGCYLSSCSIPNSVDCDYAFPMPLGDTAFKANCGKCGEPCEHLNVPSESYIEFELPQIDNRNIDHRNSVDGNEPDHQQYHAPSQSDLSNNPQASPQAEPVKQARKIPKTPLIEDYY